MGGFIAPRPWVFARDRPILSLYMPPQPNSTLTHLKKIKFWAKSENSHTQRGLRKDIYLLILFSTLLTGLSLLFLKG